jgi:hypothetical protein
MQTLDEIGNGKSRNITVERIKFAVQEVQLEDSFLEKMHKVEPKLTQLKSQNQSHISKRLTFTSHNRERVVQIDQLYQTELIAQKLLQIVKNLSWQKLIL